MLQNHYIIRIMSAVLPAQYIRYNSYTLESHEQVNDTHLITKLTLTVNGMFVHPYKVFIKN